jgi:hypothetical protein
MFMEALVFSGGFQREAGSDGLGRRRPPEEGEAVAKLCDGYAGIVVSMLTMVCSSLSQISGCARRRAVQLDI